MRQIAAGKAALAGLFTTTIRVKIMGAIITDAPARTGVFGVTTRTNRLYTPAPESACFPPVLPGAVVGQNPYRSRRSRKASALPSMITLTHSFTFFRSMLPAQMVAPSLFFIPSATISSASPFTGMLALWVAITICR